MRSCRLCLSSKVDPLPFAVPPENGDWVRCAECGSDSNSIDYNDVRGDYGPEYLDEFIRMAGGVDRLREQVRSNCEWFDHHHRPGLPKDFLDVGCMDGAALYEMKSKGWGVLGFDVAPRPHLNEDGIGTVVGPHFSEWIFRRKFTAVLCREVIEHVPGPDLLLYQMFQVLRPGGLLQVQTPQPMAEYHDHVYQRFHLFIPSKIWLEIAIRGAMLDPIEWREWGPPERGQAGIAVLCRATG